MHFHKVKILTDKEISSIKKNQPKVIGARLKSFREKLKITQTDLAQAVGKDRQYLYKIEKGLVTPNISTLICLITALEISVQDFFSDCND